MNPRLSLSSDFLSRKEFVARIPLPKAFRKPTAVGPAGLSVLDRSPGRETRLRRGLCQRPHSDPIVFDDGKVPLPVGAIGDGLHHELDELVLGQRRKTKEKNTGRPLPVVLKDQRAEILVKGDQQPLLVVGTSQNGPIVDPRLYASDPRSVMPLVPKRRHDRKWDVFVGEEVPLRFSLRRWVQFFLGP